MSHKMRRTLIPSILALFALIFLFESILAYPDPGNNPYDELVGNAETGCLCHGAPSESDAVVAILQGVPETYEAGATYNLTIHIERGSQAPAQVDSGTKGGFSLKVSRGILNIPDDMVSFVRLNSEGEAWHTLAGDKRGNDWELNWTAPSSGTVTFFLAVNAVNGNMEGSPTSTIGPTGDAWSASTFTSKGPPVEKETSIFPGRQNIIVLSSVLLMLFFSAIVYFTQYQKEPGNKK